MSEPIELKPGAMYALIVEERMSRATAEQIRATWLEAAPEGARVMILSGGLQITELTDEALLALGLQRIPA